MSGLLAIDGGTPVRTAPLPSWPSLGDEEVAAAERVLRSNRINYWTGDEGRTFEAEYAEAVGRRHGVALANGTLALELALRAFGIGAGDEVIVPARTFFATASAVVAVGARPVFADVDRESGNLTADTVASALSRETRAVIPVHVGGWPVEMDPLMALARDKDLRVIEDCAQAHGAVYSARQAGALGSDAACFSFCQDKVLPIGEGGMLVLDDDDAYGRAWAYKDHGKSLARARGAVTDSAGGCFRWLIDSFGSNWRLAEVGAAIGRVGLRKLTEWHEARVRNATQFAAGLEAVPGLRVPLPGRGIEHAFYRLYAYVDRSALADGWDRDRIVASIAAEGAPAHYGTCSEVYREHAVEAAGFAPARPLPIAHELHLTSMAFPMHPTLREADVADMVEGVRKVMKEAVA